jgi:opacity protein-like surface antigen
MMSPASKPLPKDDYIRDPEMMMIRNSYQNALLIEPVDKASDRHSDIYSGKVKHQKPLSGGLGVSYHLTDRWSLNSGVVYTLLRSKGTYYDEIANEVNWKRNLHYLGVPLTVSYSIAEWNRIHFYITGGGMVEWNVSGKFKQIVSTSTEELESVINEDVRMKTPMWSVNTRAGAAYPLWKFINLYAEAGVCYYFDNHSEIKTVRSDKPFNVSLQAGIRLGF